MSGKPKAGSRKKSSTDKYRKRRKKELLNRAIKDHTRKMAEAEFAQRIQKEPGLADLLEGRR